MDRRAESGYAARWINEGTSGDTTVIEAEWLACTDPQTMLEFLRGKPGDRKLRLFVAGCIRLIASSRGPEMESAKAMISAAETIEGYADGKLIPADRTTVYHSRVYRSDFLVATCPDDPHQFAERCVRSFRPEPLLASTLLRDLFGRLPFRLVTIDRAWLSWHGGLLVSMAQQMYESRDFSGMPVLADALEEAGCTDQDILSHCRSGGEHLKGCWVADLLLDKS